MKYFRVLYLCGVNNNNYEIEVYVSAKSDEYAILESRKDINDIQCVLSVKEIDKQRYDEYFKGLADSKRWNEVLKS